MHPEEEHDPELDDCLSVGRIPDDLVMFSQDETLAAGICRNMFLGSGEGVAIIPVQPACTQSALQVVAVRRASALRWVPSTHMLLVLEGRQLSLLNADASPPAVLRSAALPESPSKFSLCFSPGGEAAVLLSSEQSDALFSKATLTLYSPASLDRMSTTSWQLANPPAAVVPDQSISVHCSQQSVAAVFNGVGTRVYSFSGSQLGRARFWARGLHQTALSCTGFLAGIRASCHEVLCGRTGATLFKLPMLVPDLEQPAAKALSVGWAGPDDSALHACYCQSISEDEECCTLLYRLLSFS